MTRLQPESPATLPFPGKAEGRASLAGAWTVPFASKIMSSHADDLHGITQPGTHQKKVVFLVAPLFGEKLLR